MDTVVRLIDRAPGYSPDSPEGLMEWARNWIEALASGDYGPVLSLAIVVEGQNTKTAVISQGLGHMDGMRLIGLLTLARHRLLNGTGSIAELRQ